MVRRGALPGIRRARSGVRGRRHRSRSGIRATRSDRAADSRHPGSHPAGDARSFQCGAGFVAQDVAPRRPDPTFGADGRLEIAAPISNVATVLAAPARDDAVEVMVLAPGETGTDGVFRPAYTRMLRIGADGRGDPALGGDGGRILDPPQPGAEPVSAFRQIDGRWLVAYRGSDALDFVVRYLPDGATDRTLAGGRLELLPPHNATARIAALPRGRIVVLWPGSSLVPSLLDAYSAYGTPDLAYGEGGRVTLSYDEVQDYRWLAPTADDQLIVFGADQSISYSKFAVCRLDRAGRHDVRFGVAGCFLRRLDIAGPYGANMLVANDGAVIVPQGTRLGTSPDISRGRGETARDPMSHNDDRGIRRHDEVFRRPFHRYRVGRWSFGRLAWSSLGP
jgi:hypothetical protein